MNINEIMNLNETCIQEEPACCVAACPVKVNVPFIIQNIRLGNYEQAYKLYERKVLFPGIISRICDEPCGKSCIRNRIDDPVSIRLLEKAVVDHRKSNAPVHYAAVRKNQSVCVVGSSLSGMCCAMDLARKGFTVALYEKAGRLGGRLNDIDPARVPHEILEEEVNRLKEEEIEICLNRKVSGLEDLKFDACFIAGGNKSDEFIRLLPAEKSNKEFQITLESTKNGVFILPDQDRDHWSPIAAVRQGLQASRSIERYLKVVSLYSGREEELSSDTNLYTDISREGEKKVVVPVGESGYSKEEADREASRCLLCECLECSKQCLYLKNYKGYPKTYIKDYAGMYYAPKGLTKRKHMHQLNSCSGCGLCKELCPAALDMGQASEALKKLFCAGGTMPDSFHDFWLRDLEFSSGDSFFTVKGQPGIEKSRYMFFPGCQMAASDPGYVINTYQYLLAEFSDGVGLYLGCCGAPADWAGRTDLLEKNIRLIQENWDSQGRPEIILACPTCHKVFRKYMKEIPVKSLWNIFNEHDLPEDYAEGNGKEIAVYDPCASRYLPDVQKSVRDLLNKMGYKIEELSMSGRYAQCCSYGGLISTVNPRLAQKIRDQRVGASTKDYVTYCTNCRDDFVGNGKTAWHLLDMIFGGENGDKTLKKPPSRSQRRENREEVRKSMLEKFWGEKTYNSIPEYKNISLVLSDDVMRKMDDRFILADELKQVIHHGEKSGFKLINRENGHIFAHLKIGSVTYWAEYVESGERFEIFSVYSHRVQLTEESSRNESRT